MTAIAAVLFLLLGPAESPDKEVERASQLYREARFNESLALTDAILAQEPAANVRIECRALRAFSLFFLGLYPAARDEWLGLLELSPDYVIDPIEHSPEVIAFFSRVRAQPEQGDTIMEPSGATPVPDPYPQATTTTIEEPQCRPWLCLIPFGGGQFVKRAWVKGSIFAGLSAVFLGTNIGLYQARRAEYERLGYLEDLDAADRNYLIQNIALGLFVTTLATGIVEAYVF